MSVFTMPSLGADMEAGKLVEWLVKPGDHVKHGDVVAVVETQKGAIEIEVFEDGTVEKLKAKIGQTLDVGAPLALISGADEASQGQAAAAPEPAAPVPKPKVKASRKAAPKRPAVGADVPASPAARARAAELGIDLTSVRGSGPGGAVVLADVSRQPAAAPAEQTGSSAPSRASTLADMRKAIAAAMSRSKREIPHYYMNHTVDLEAATRWLKAANAERPPEARLVMGALLARATALAAKTEPTMNGHFEADGFAASDRVHLGVAVALRGGGLVAPAILDADTLSLSPLMEAMRDATARARAGRLRASELSMATLTLSSLGEGGVESMAGIIVPPQVALLTVGTPRPAALVRDGSVVPRQAAAITLAADHRVSDGRLGARFLLEIDRLLQAPEAL